MDADGAASCKSSNAVEALYEPMEQTETNKREQIQDQRIQLKVEG